MLVLAGICWGNGLVSGAVMTLVKNGIPESTIVLAQRPTRAAQFAAFELQHHIKLITGAVVPIVRDGEPAYGVKILVGESKGTKVLGLKNDGFKDQEYLIKFIQHAIILMGRDKLDFGTVKYDYLHDPSCISTWPDYYDQQATMYAVYDFLEKYCGVRWFNPTDTGTEYPKKTTLIVKVGKDILRKPFFRYRGWEGSGDYDAYTGLWPENTEEFKDYDKIAYADLHKKFSAPNLYNLAKQARVKLFLLRQKTGGEKWFANHSLYHYYQLFWEPSPNKEKARYFVAHRPEMFVKGYKGIPPQMDYTSPELIKEVAREADEYFNNGGYPYKAVLDNAPLGLKWGKNCFAVVPMDNTDFYRSGTGQAFFRKKIWKGKGYFSNGQYSDYWFSFVNKVAKKLKKTHPNKYIITLAYASYAYPPDFPLESNVIVEFCFSSNRMPYSGEYQNELKALSEWRKSIKDRPIYLWLYPTFPKEIANDGHFHCFPGFYAHTLSREFKLFKSYDIGGMFFCGFGQEADDYVTFKLADNPSLNVNDVLNEYFTGMYGPAAKYMKKFYLLVEKTYTDPANYKSIEHPGHQNIQIAWGLLGTEARMEQLRKLMKKAKRLAVTKKEKRNVELFDLGVWKYMEAGRTQYVERTSAPIPSIRVPAVEDAGGDPAKILWNKASILSGGWFERSSEQPAPRKLYGNVAHDGKYLYVKLVDQCDTKKLVASPGVFPYDDWEIFTAAQRSLPYRQFAFGPNKQVVALSNGEINWRMNVPIENPGIRVISDVSTTNLWVTLIAIPLKILTINGVKPDGIFYMNITRVSSPELLNQPVLDIYTWVPYCTVQDVDRLAKITLEK